MMQFRSIFFLASFFALLACQTPKPGETATPLANSQESTESMSSPRLSEYKGMSTEKVIQAIQVELKRLYSLLPQLEPIQFEDDQHFGEVQLSAWKDNGEWVKIQLDQTDGHGMYKEDYYFQEGQLFFCFIHSEYALIHEEADNHVGEERFYLGQGNVLLALKKEYTFPYDKRADMSSIANQEVSLPDSEEKYRFLKERADQLIVLAEDHVKSE